MNKYFEIRPRQLSGSSALNTSTLSTDVAKIETARRKEYEKVEQVNAMYMGAKALGFPEQVSEIENPYYVVVSIPNCFNSRDIVGESPTSFIRLRLKSGTLDIDDPSLIDDNNEIGIPNFVVWLLVCMKLFYRRDWDGRKWIDEKEGFTKYGESLSTYSEPGQVSTITEEVIKELSKKMAEDIDNEIMKAITNNPENWKVQAGNIAYGSGDKVTIVNPPSIKIKPYIGGL